MLGKRGDVAYAVSIASRYLANPGPQHMNLARRILRYLNGTKGLRLTYKGQPQMLKGFTDADWGDVARPEGQLLDFFSISAVEQSAGNQSAKASLPSRPVRRNF